MPTLKATPACSLIVGHSRWGLKARPAPVLEGISRQVRSRPGRLSVRRETSTLGCSGSLSTASYTSKTVSTHPANNSEEKHLELPVEELLRRARPLPPHDEMVIEDLTEEDGAAFLAAVDS